MFLSSRKSLRFIGFTVHHSQFSFFPPQCFNNWIHCGFKFFFLISSFKTFLTLGSLWNFYFCLCGNFNFSGDMVSKITAVHWGSDRWSFCLSRWSLFASIIVRLLFYCCSIVVRLLFDCCSIVVPMLFCLSLSCQDAHISFPLHSNHLVSLFNIGAQCSWMRRFPSLPGLVPPRLKTRWFLLVGSIM